MPSNALDAFGLLRTASRCDDLNTGDSLTVVTYGALVQKAMLAALQLEKRDPKISIEVIDLRSLAPYDWTATRASVAKTRGRDCARIASELFEKLDAPVRRVGARTSPYATIYNTNYL